MSKAVTRRELVGGAAAGAALVTLRGAPALARRRTRSARVVVVGAGLSGLAAAIAPASTCSSSRPATAWAGGC